MAISYDDYKKKYGEKTKEYAKTAYNASLSTSQAKSKYETSKTKKQNAINTLQNAYKSQGIVVNSNTINPTTSAGLYLTETEKQNKYNVTAQTATQKAVTGAKGVKENTDKYNTYSQSSEAKDLQNKVIEAYHDTADAYQLYQSKKLEDDDIGLYDKTIGNITRGATSFFNIGEADVNENGQLYFLPGYTKAKQEKVQESYGDGLLGTVGKLASSALYEAGRIAVTSVANKLLPGVGEATYFSDIYLNQLNTALSEDKTSEQALAYATLSTATEIVTGKLLGGVSKQVFGSGTSSELSTNINKVISKVITNHPRLVNAISNGLSEGAEEFIQEYMDVIIRNLTLGEDEQVFTSETFENAIYSGIVGSITGGIFGATDSSTYEQQVLNYQVSELTKQIENATSASEKAKYQSELDSLVEKAVDTLSDTTVAPINGNNASTGQNITAPISGNTVANNQTNATVSTNTAVPIDTTVTDNTSSTTNTTRESACKYFGQDNFDINEALDIIENIKQTRSTNGTLDVVFDDTVSSDGVHIQDGNNRTIVLNPKSSNWLEQILVHELAHDVENTDTYQQLQEYVREIATEDENYESAKASLEETYRQYYTSNNLDFSEVDMDIEVTNDILAKVLGNQESLNTLATKDPNLLQKIYRWIRNVLFDGRNTDKSFTERQQLYRIENMLRQALNQGYVQTTSDTKYSIAGINGLENMKTSKFKNDGLYYYNKALSMAEQGIDNETIRQETKWFQDKNGDWKFEIDDSSIKIIKDIKPNSTYKLGEIVSHESLFEMYPELKEYDVKFSEMKTNGSFSSRLESIKINNNLLRKNSKNLKGTLIHEIQHAIQYIENFEGGTNSVLSRKAYYEKLGEIEADNQKRRYMNDLTKEDRLKIAPESSKSNPKHSQYDNYMSNRGKIDKIKDKVYPITERIFLDEKNSEEIMAPINKKNSREVGVDGLELDNSSFLLDKKAKRYEDLSKTSKITYSQETPDISALEQQAEELKAKWFEYREEHGNDETTKELQREYSRLLSKINNIKNPQSNNTNALPNQEMSVQDIDFETYELTNKDISGIQKVANEIIKTVDYGEEFAESYVNDLLNEEVDILKRLNKEDFDIDEYQYSIGTKIENKLFDLLKEEGISLRKEDNGNNYVFDRRELAQKGYNELLDYLDEQGIDYETSRSWNAGYVPSVYVKDSNGDTIFRIANHKNNNVDEYNYTYNDKYKTIFDDKDYANWEDKIKPKINELLDEHNSDTKYSVDNKEWEEYLNDNWDLNPNGKKTNMSEQLAPIKSDIEKLSNKIGELIESTDSDIAPINYTSQSNSEDVLNPSEISNLTLEDANTTPQLPISKKYNKIGDGKSKYASNIENKTNMLNEEQKNRILSEDDVKYYDKITNKESLDEAFERLDSGRAETERWFNIKPENATATDVAEGWILLKQYADNDNPDGMVEVAKKMRNIGTKAGQTVQAFNIMERMTPEGMVKYAQSELTEAYNALVKNKTKKWIDKNASKFDLNTQEVEAIVDIMNKVQTMEDGYEKNVELAKIQKIMSDKIPPAKGAGIKSWMRISMLFNPKTQVRNILGNVTIMPVNYFSDLFASTVDKTISKKTGYRTTGITNVKNYVKGFKKGIYESYNDFKLDINTRNIEGNRFEIGEGKSFKQNTKLGRALNKTNSLLSFMLDAGDRGFYEGSFVNSINNQLALNNTTEVTQDMIDIATQEALSRTWQDNNGYTKFVLDVRKGLNKISFKGYGLGDVLIPFAKSPANLTKAIIDYSPAGLVSTLTKGVNLKNAIETGQYTPQMQHEFVQSLGKATAGTMLYVLGYALAKAGITTGESDDDKDVKDFMKNSLGINSYSIKIGDTTFTYDWAQPIAAPLSIMANIVNESNSNANLLEIVLSSLDTAGNILLEQSFMESISTVLNNNDGVVTGLQEALFDLPARAIPTLFKQIVDLTDSTQRTTFEYNQPIQSMINSIKAKIPGLSQTLAPVVNSMGEEVQRYGGKNSIFNVFFNPANVNTENVSDSAVEIYSVYEATGDATILPRVAPYYFTIDGEKTILSSEDRSEFHKISGEIIENGVAELMSTVEYSQMTSEEKASYIKSIVDYAYNKAKSEVLGTTISDDYTKLETYIDSGGDVADYYLHKEEVDYSIEYPVKYKIITLISSYDNYQTYKDELETIRDSTENKKEATINYIDSLNLNIVQKAMFIKQYYSSFDDYDYEIVNYIVNQDLTVSEKESILTKLGFTVKDGRVYY